MWVPSLSWEDPLEKEMVTHSSMKNPMDGGAGWATVHKVAKSHNWTQYSNIQQSANKQLEKEAHGCLEP